MATLNLATNGPSINSSYKKIVDSPLPAGAAASSPTYGQWALFTVQAPLVSAFQQDSGKESVLKVQTTGEGELIDLIEEFSDGRVQFAFVKVKDPNTGLPKNVLIAWCGEGVPERTKGYFNTHLAAVTKLLHGYHVQITARSDSDLSPEGIVQKVSDSSGAKYGGGSTPAPASTPSAGPPPVASKPVFMPTRSGGTGGFNPLGSRGRAAAPSGATDNDGWGEDAPQVTRSQLEKVAPAYKPTKVNMAELTNQKQEPSRFQPAQRDTAGSGDVVKGGYQPIGKVDIAAIRRQAQEQGKSTDDRPTPVKGSYEPIGKVDIAAIRAKASGPSAPSPASPVAPQQSEEQDSAPKSLADRSAAFTSAGRITELPKPKVANRFGSNASTFTGTKAPTPGGFESKPLATSAPIGAADKNFAAQGGKTPAQLWAEKKARERGMSGSGDAPSSAGFNAPASPINAQQSGGWQSGYSGKKWGDVQTNRTGASNISAQQTGASNVSAQRTGHEEPQEEVEPPTGGVSSIRDRFKNAAPMGAAKTTANDDDGFSSPPPPPMDLSSKPNAGAPRGVPMPGLPQRPAAAPEAPEDHPAEEHVNIPPPPPQAPRSPSPEPDEDFAPSSPVRIAMPVARSAEPAPISPPEESEPPMPTASLAAAAKSHAAAEPEPHVTEDEPARGAAMAAAGAGAATADPGAAVSGKRALIQYDYEKAEDNEIELREGDYVINIEMVDEDWWMGQNSQGETGLFPSNYVELIEDDDAGVGSGAAAPAPSAPHVEEPEPVAPAGGHAGGKTATAQYDYEATEDNELSFPEGAKIENIEFPDDDWWLGEYAGKQGLFPANYVELDA